MNKIISSGVTSASSSGLWKAFFYSFGSWLVVWAITWLASDQAYIYLGKYGWVIPVANTIAVFFKQYFDAFTAKK